MRKLSLMATIDLELNVIFIISYKYIITEKIRENNFSSYKTLLFVLQQNNSIGGLQYSIHNPHI